MWSEPASWVQRLLGLEEKLEINQLWMSSWAGRSARLAQDSGRAVLAHESTRRPSSSLSYFIKMTSCPFLMSPRGQSPQKETSYQCIFCLLAVFSETPSHQLLVKWPGGWAEQLEESKVRFSEIIGTFPGAANSPGLGDSNWLGPWPLTHIHLSQGTNMLL